MNRKTHTTAIVALAILAGCFRLAAQDSTKAPPAALPTEAKPEITKLFNPGDKYFSISLGAEYGMFNMNPITGAFESSNLNESKWPGGTAALEWSFFVSPGFALGGDLGASVNFTPSGRGLYIVPITLKASYFFSNLPWEFPVSLGFGPCITTVSDASHVDMFVKPQAGIFYRVTPDWSFGGNLSWWVIPQIYWKHKDQDRIGNFVQLSMTALYHF
jgi:hypothetical protein